MNTAQKPLGKGVLLGDRYQIERLLGTGDLGDVYLCRDLGEGKARLAIKVLSSDGSVPGGTGASSRELSLLQRLRHPNLVRILDFGIVENSGAVFLAEEWIEGKNLIAGTAGMDAEGVLNLIAELSKTLQYLHTRGIVHGNLKPSNTILLGADNGVGKAKLLDFGLIQLSHGKPHAIGSGMLAYTAPEIFLGGRVSESSDMYSLGILTYRLLTRRLPFEDEDPGFLVQKHLQGGVDMRPIEHLNGGVKVTRLVRGLLEKDPARRPSSGEEVLGLLSDALGRDLSGVNVKELESHFSASQFVGREREMLFLQGCAKQVRESGRGRTVFITGEAGSGKTRCMEELRSWALLMGWRVIEGACGVRKESAYEPYRQILAKTELANERAIFDFAQLPQAAASNAFNASSELAAGQFRDLLTRELIRRLAQRPTMLFLHDFCRADEATGAVLDYLSSDIQAHPILMCVSFRSGEVSKSILDRVVDPAVRQERGETLTLEPLVEESVQQLVAGMMGDSGLKETLGSWIFRSVGGNPFFLEEMLKHLVEQGFLCRHLGKWKFIEEDLKRLEVPASVGAVLQQRLAQLSPAARELAHWLAVFHRAVSRKLLNAIAPERAGDIAEALQELSRRQMIRTENREPTETVDLSHALITEVILGCLPKKLLQKMHRRIAEVLERERGAEGRLQELAMHHIEGKSQALSVRSVLAAASQSRAEFAHESALRCFEHVFRNRSSLTAEELCNAAIEASDTILALGIPKRAIRLLQAEMHRNKAIRADLKARMFMQLALAYQYLGDLRMQEVCGKRGLRFFRNHSHAETNLTKAMLWAELAFGGVLQSRPRRGLLHLDRALQSCPDQNPALSGRIQSLSASLHRVACNLYEALKASEKAAAILSHSTESYLTCSAYSTLGGILMGIGRFPLALERHSQAVSLSDKSRSTILRSQALGNLAECLSRMGRIQEALTAADHAAKSVCESGNPAISYAFNTILAEVQLAAGNYRSARQIVDKLKQEGGRNVALFTMGHAHYVAANLNFALGNFGGALEHIEQISGGQTREAPFYEYELAEALRARILCERGSVRKAVRNLLLLDRAVTKKRWPYHMCIIKLHMCEVLIKQQKLQAAERCAKNALRLAKVMQSIPLLSQGHLLLGLIYSPLRGSNGQIGSRSPLRLQDYVKPSSERSIEELRRCCQASESAFPNDSVWRAHTELCLIFESLHDEDQCLAHAKKAHELLCKLEDQVPSEMLPAFYGSFDRSGAKLELVRVIENSRELERNRGVAVAQIRDDEKARILLRVSATVNTIRELDPLLEAILDQLIPAVDVERALVFLRDESTGQLEMAKGRNICRESLSDTELIRWSILESVCREGRPIVSADAQRDPRISKESALPEASGRFLCAPLKASDRVMGALYADHSSPVGSLSESAINLFAAFCNLAAIAIDNALAHQHLVREKTELERYLHQAREGYAEIVGESASVEALRDRIGLAAASPLDILIVGESGTGKELVAKAIYRTGKRKLEKFVPVDCGSLSDSLAEAELFGYRKGSFTGATENREGLLEAAHGGTVFLDEISNLPFRLQAKLLRVLQEREVRRIGETAPRKIDIQVIAATNKDLLEEMKNGRFRKDLFYRLKTMEIRVPPLRERPEDIPVLIEWFMGKAAELEGGRFKKLLPEAMELLKAYSYPGNIRELKNIIAGAYYSTVGSSIGLDQLPPEVRREDVWAVNSESKAADRLYREILEGRGNFEDLIKEPFLKHQIARSLVRGVIQKALKDAGGKYRDAFARLRIPDHLYASTMQFLKRNKCYLDFRPFRRNRPKSDL